MPPGASGGPLPGAPGGKSGGKGQLIAGLVVGVVVLILLCGGGVTAGIYIVRDGSDGGTSSVAIEGVVDYRTTQPEILTTQHVAGDSNYAVKPPVGGDHDAVWQNCQGDVYATKIDDGHAVHSLEHGAVWITYRPDLTPDQVDSLKARVTGKDYTFLSPYPGLESPISLQAWGYQLKVNDADDERIDKFLEEYRITASIETGAPCSNGTTVAD
ncbi:DUF3105 domain-containing protein [Cryptosporangium aurantiacum]|uniref:DUF3105 domain-containing protein n=1 Tax=Cryptosporangium aurantiacum TaxID=134849 RepID=A0A1M7H6A0_9ACTN|nr:DUF3105 domain-containing protein [Cryptosporangium aurantiacum]SHM24131.1 Protein of unknown function [Cryptosporangium aurantiacum]